MMKSDIDIKDDIYRHIKGSELEAEVTGKLCKRMRPPRSEAEDICISVLANENAQIQDAYVYVNIYVPDELVVYETMNLGESDLQSFHHCNICENRSQKDISSSQQYEEQTPRLRKLCSMAEELLSVGHGAGYRFSLVSQRVMEVKGKNEHFIANKLLYRMCNEKPY